MEKKKLMLWAILGIVSFFWVNTYAININAKIMNLLSNKIHNTTLIKYLWQNKIKGLNKYCSRINTWQVINLVNKWLKEKINKKQKIEILLKSIYLYKCILDFKKQQEIQKQDKEKQLLSIIQYYLSHWWWWEIMKLKLDDNTKNIIRNKINSLINELSSFEKPTWEIKISTETISKELSSIKFIVKSNKKNVEWFKTAYDNIYYNNNINLYDSIKVSSDFWLRYLLKDWEFHFWTDITLINKKADVNYNCNYKPSYYHNITENNYIKHKKYFNKDICKTNINNLPDYKKMYDIYTRINLNQIKQNGWECYIWNHLSRYSNKLVWFWNFLICKLSKNDNVRTLMGHNANFNYLIKSWLFTKLSNNNLDYIKLDWMTASFYQRNYPTFDKYKHNFVWNMLVNYLTNIWIYRLELYKLDLNKAINKWFSYLLVKYWTTGHSFWKHIHWGILLKNNIYVSPLNNQKTWFKLLWQMFNNNQVWEKNYYYSVYSLTYKWK